MKKMLMLGAAVVVAFNLNAGSFIVHVKMPDGSVKTIELASVPNPDSNGMYHFHLKTSGDIIVHASNVWIEEKSNKSKGKDKQKP